MNESVTFALFGNPVSQSLSPLMHGAAFAKRRIRATYTAYQVNDAADIVRTIRERGINGASITIPFKETVMTFLHEVDANASKIGAVNTIINRDGKLIGYNTDGPGLIRDLTEWIAIRGKTFVILGAGGAARAAVSALIQEGGTPVVVNRTAERTHGLAGHFGCRWGLPAEINRLEADCLINTTPLGMFPDTDRTPLMKKSLVHFPQVMDMIYNPVKTRLSARSQCGRMRHPLRRRDVRSPGGGTDPSLDGT